METPDWMKLENQLCFPLYAASRLVTRAYQPLLANWDLTYPQYLLLLVLWEKDNQTVSQLCDCLLLETNTLTPLIQRLEKRGLIKREQVPYDKRSSSIKLTRKGKALKEELKSVPPALVESLSDKGPSLNELHALKAILDRLIQGMQSSTP